MSQVWQRNVQGWCGTGTRTVVMCAGGVTDGFVVGLHQGSALIPFLFAVVTD